MVMSIKFSDYWGEFEGTEYESRWLSFCTNEKLVLNASDVCSSCYSNVIQQLELGFEKIDLDLAMGCYKVVSVFEDEAQCTDFVLRYLFDSSGEFFGKIGGMRNKDDVSVVIYVTEEQKDEMLEKSKIIAKQISEDSKSYISRGCDIYKTVFGSSEDWENPAEVKNPENIRKLKSLIRQ